MHFPIFCGQYAQDGQELAGNLPKRGALRVRAGLRLGDDLTLDEHVLGQTRDLDAASGREGLGEIAGVDGVDGGEIVHVLDEHRRLDGLGHVAAGRLQHGGQVAEDLMRLRLDAVGDGAGGGVDADLAGREPCGSVCGMYRK